MSLAWLRRLNIVSMILSVVTLALTLGLCIDVSKRFERQHQELQDAIKRLTTVESVYDTSECALVMDESVACQVGEVGQLSLGQPDKDGEVRWLLLRTAEQKTERIGQLSQDASYVRLHNDQGEAEGYILDSTQGTIEVYAAHPALSPSDEERLPIMIKHLFPEAVTTSTSP